MRVKTYLDLSKTEVLVGGATIYIYIYIYICGSSAPRPKFEIKGGRGGGSFNFERNREQGMRIFSGAPPADEDI